MRRPWTVSRRRWLLVSKESVRTSPGETMGWWGRGNSKHRSPEVDKSLGCLRKSKVSGPRVDSVRGRAVGNEWETDEEGRLWTGIHWKVLSKEWQHLRRWHCMIMFTGQEQTRPVGMSLQCSSPDERWWFGTRVVRHGQILDILKVELTWFADRLGVKWEIKESEKPQSFVGLIELPSSEMRQIGRSWFRGIDLEFIEHVRFQMCMISD